MHGFWGGKMEFLYSFLKVQCGQQLKERAK